MRHEKITDILQENKIIVVDVIHLGSELVRGSASSKLDEVFNLDLEQVLPQLDPIMLRDADRVDDLLQLACDNNKFGFLFQFATPVASKITKRGAAYSWSAYFTTWIYSESLEGALQPAIAWKEETWKERKKELAEMEGAADES